MVNEKDNCNNCGCDGKKIDSFVDSIEEEIRNENWQKLWDKYGKLITYASCAIIAGVGVYGMWQKQDLSDREAISSRYTLVQSSIMSGKQDVALSQIRELSNVSKKDYAVLAKFEYAAILREKDQKEALFEYKSIFEDKSTTEMLRDLAYIFYVSSSIDLLPAKDLGLVIDGLIKDLNEKYIGKTWDLFAKETLAFCYIKQGDNESAKTALQSLAKTTGIPEAMAERVKMLLHSIGE